MSDGSLLDTNYSDKELQAANTARKKQAEKLHTRAWNFIKKVCPFQR